MPVSAKRTSPQDRKKKQQTKKRVTSAKAWRAGSAINQEFILTLPSGNVATVIRPGLESMVANGDIPDALLDIAQGAIDKGQGKRPDQELDEKTAADFAGNPEKWGLMLDSVDRIATRIMKEPVVAYAKRKIEGTDEWEVIPEEDRFEDVLYTDEIELDDKFFVFDFACGDSADLERFHAERKGRVERILDGDQVSRSSE